MAKTRVYPPPSPEVVAEMTQMVREDLLGSGRFNQSRWSELEKVIGKRAANEIRARAERACDREYRDVVGVAGVMQSVWVRG